MSWSNLAKTCVAWDQSLQTSHPLVAVLAWSCLQSLMHGDAYLESLLQTHFTGQNHAWDVSSEWMWQPRHNEPALLLRWSSFLARIQPLGQPPSSLTTLWPVNHDCLHWTHGHFRRFSLHHSWSILVSSQTSSGHPSFLPSTHYYTLASCSSWSWHLECIHTIWANLC